MICMVMFAVVHTQIDTLTRTHMLQIKQKKKNERKKERKNNNSKFHKKKKYYGSFHCLKVRLDYPININIAID